ncbi:hypothetical protein [Corynebacterium comes]|nr:hypothetical protein [Corynebacterium comes]
MTNMTVLLLPEAAPDPSRPRPAVAPDRDILPVTMLTGERHA